jgi:transcription termination factor NusB
VLDALGTKGDPVGNPDYKNIKPYVDEMLEKKRKIDEKIKEDMKNQISYQELAQTFEAVGKELTKDQMKEF